MTNFRTEINLNIILLLENQFLEGNIFMVERCFIENLYGTNKVMRSYWKMLNGLRKQGKSRIQRSILTISFLTYCSFQEWIHLLEPSNGRVIFSVMV